MKKYLAILCLLSANGIKSYGQVLWSENFNSGITKQMILNTTDFVNDTPCVSGSTWNAWIINDSYTGGDVELSSTPCSPLSGLSGSVNNTPGEPEGVTGATSADTFHTHYLHIYSPINASNVPPVLNATWAYAGDGIVSTCPPAENYFVKMNSGVSTLGKSNVFLRYYWACGGVTTYGQSYYSIDGGNTWILLVGSYTSQTTWKLDSIHIAAFDDVADLRFGFLWVSPFAGFTPSGIEPSFSLDDISIAAPFPTSINEISLENTLQAYPDPFTNQIRITSGITSADIESIEIYDVLGRIVLQQKPGALNRSSLQIDASALQQGAYFLRIITKEGIYTKSLIKE